MYRLHDVDLKQRSFTPYMWPFLSLCHPMLTNVSYMIFIQCRMLKHVYKAVRSRLNVPIELLAHLHPWQLRNVNFFCLSPNVGKITCRRQMQ